MAGDKFPPEFQKKLDALIAEYERDRKTVLKRLDALGITDPILLLALLQRIDPEGARRGMEDALIDQGMTDADVRALLKVIMAKVRRVN